MSTVEAAKSIPMSIKGPHSLAYAEDKEDAFRKERYVLTFDFETNALPDESVVWDNFEIEDTYRKYANGDLVKDKKTRQPVPMPASDASKWPHSVQFCYILYDNQLNTAKIVNEILRLPEGVEMSRESEAVHKISLAQSQGQTKRVVNPKTGEELLTHNPEIHEVLVEFMSDFERADVIVAHNLRFDRNMLLAEMDRLRKSGRPEFEIFNEYIRNLYENKKEFCTANFGADVCQIAATNKAGKEYYKMPKLNALYTHLFGYAPDESKLHDALMDVVICMRCFYKIRYDIDLCDTELDHKIAGYIELMSPEGYKCSPAKAAVDTGKGGSKTVDNILDQLSRRSNRLIELSRIDYAEGKSRKKQPKKRKGTKSGRKNKTHSKKKR